MAAEHPKENSDASYRFFLPLESIDDEEIHSDTDTFYMKQKILPESGETSSWELSLNKFDEWLNDSFHCGICWLDLPKHEKFPMKCVHQFCNGCIGTFVTARVKENDIPIKCPMLDSKCSFLELDMCHNIVTEDIIKKWGFLLEDSTFGLSNQDKFSTKNFHGTSEENEILLINLARRNRWKICPNCNFCIEKVGGCQMVKCRCECIFCYACGLQAEDCTAGSCPLF